MIRSFSCKNFYSFADESKISFLINDKAPDKESYFKSPAGDRLNKALVVIGPNASGKTNLIKVLPFLKWLILESFNMKPEAEIPVKPFLFHDFKNKPIELSVEFEIKKDVYIYTVSLNTKRVLEEELKIRNQTKQKITTKVLFSRKWDEKKEKYDFVDKNFKLPNNFGNLIRSNASIVGTAIQFNHENSKLIGEFWRKVQTNVSEMGLPEDFLFFSAPFNFYQAIDFYSENKVLKEKAEKLLSRFDIGLKSFSVKKEKKGQNVSLDAHVLHFFDGQTHKLPIQYESSGTKQLFTLLKSILQALDRGGTAVLDELDANLHPDMVSTLYELFISPDTNPKNAQIIFSTHSLRILSELDKYQIVLVEKNDKGSSEAWRLDEVSGVRADDNYYAKYVAGAYGAVPRID